MKIPSWRVLLWLLLAGMLAQCAHRPYETVRQNMLVADTPAPSCWTRLSADGRVALSGGGAMCTLPDGAGEYVPPVPFVTVEPLRRVKRGN